jgi:hypothetical protein
MNTAAVNDSPLTLSRGLRDSRPGAPAIALLTALFTLAGAAGPGSAQTQEPSPLADMEWLSGAWSQDRGGDRLEEWWSAPVGNSMVGTFRWVRGGELWLTEQLSIKQEAGEVVFRLRHFSAEMAPWEAADDAFTYRLTSRAPGRVAFTILEPRSGRPDRFVFESLSGDSLLVRLEGEEDGRPTVQEFRFARSELRR